MPEKKKWTLMFYFASDNPLAPSIVSQLKALKNAGYHSQANVIAQFDPHAENTPIHVFDVNHVDKLRDSDHQDIGFTSNDPFVRNLVLDKLWGKEDRFWGEETKTIRDSIREHLNSNVGRGRGRGNGGGSIDYNPPIPCEAISQEGDPDVAFGSFLEFCRENYPADHYMLIILGHGVVVGNDMFLFDAHAKKHSLKLGQLGKALKTFREKVKREGSEFELIGFHSCSMSSLEVAYELQGTANYMLSSQGPAFVGSWPYTKILIRIFNDLVKNLPIDRSYVKETFTNIFYYCLYNSYDFQLAGYSFDLCLLDLTKVPETKAPLNELSEALSQGLGDTLAKELILLAHWDAQSFWRETYTDIYDFCFCLDKRCEEAEPGSEKTAAVLGDIRAACKKIASMLDAGTRANDDRLIIRAAFAGPAYQYSHGLSVFFPWSEPRDTEFWKGEYEGAYEFRQTSWVNFLAKYFEATKRKSFWTEMTSQGNVEPGTSIDEKLLEQITCLLFNEEGQLGKGSGSDETGKGAGSDETGGDCSCPSIKNYPSFTRERRKTGAKEDIRPLSPTFAEQFEMP